MILNINFRIEKKNPAINNSNIPFFIFYTILIQFFLATTINPKLC